ncbi:hypothetical protein TcWFU_000461 [Taenia crassiceps]|uniref:Uncharacterized protein n=1 Tax=Taenia crassiceps TaxID=6207 RepID=A0ABR4QC74_9CEST
MRDVELATSWRLSGDTNPRVWPQNAVCSCKSPSEFKLKQQEGHPPTTAPLSVSLTKQRRDTFDCERVHVHATAAAAAAAAVEWIEEMQCQDWAVSLALKVGE